MDFTEHDAAWKEAATLESELDADDIEAQAYMAMLDSILMAKLKKLAGD